MPAQHLGRADEVNVIGDENGFELHIHTPEGTYIVNVHSILGQLLEEVTREITAYLDEGEAARLSRPLRDDPDAYAALGDPKHPDWHSVHADIWDSREKGA